MKRVLVPLAPGCEELEAVSIIDILRRGEVHVTSASLESSPVTASRNVRLLADITLQEAIAADDFDMIAIPGGMGGAQSLLECAPFVQFVQHQARKGGFVAAICAAPMILGKAGLLKDTCFTAYPGVIEPDKYPGSTFTGAAIEVDKRIITSRGPGTALDFALTLLELLAGKDRRNAVEAQLVRS